MRGRSRRRGGWGRRSAPVPVRWTGDLSSGESTVAAGAATATDIVVPADYEQNATLEPGGITLVRLRLSIGLRATVVGAFCHMGVWVIGAAETAPTPSTFAALMSGDCIWWDTRFIALQANATPEHVEADIRAKRRLENDRVVFVLSAIAQNVTFVLGARALLKGG